MSSDELVAKVAENRAKFRETEAAIRGDRDLSEEAKGRRLTEAYREAMATHRRLVTEHQEAERAERAERRRAAFGPRYRGAPTESDRAAARVSFRYAVPAEAS